MRVMCGGRIAEKRHCNDISSGAAMDIQQVTKIARSMVLDWGMSQKLGFVRYSPMERNEFGLNDKPYSDDTAKLIDEEIRRMAGEAYTDAQQIIDENWDKIESVAQALLKHETLDVEEVARLCRGESLDKPSLSGLLADEAAPPSPPQAKATPQAPPEPQLPDGLPGGSLPQPG